MKIIILSWNGLLYKSIIKMMDYNHQLQHADMQYVEHIYIIESAEESVIDMKLIGRREEGYQKYTFQILSWSVIS